MEQLKSIQVMEIVNELKSYIGDNQRLEALFTEVPTTSLDVYQQTSRFYATKKYDLECKGKIIPHGFYQILVDEANRNGILASMRKYDKEITIICGTLDIEKKDIIVLLKALKKRPNEILIDSYTRNDASFKLKEYIRKFTAKYKENYIKSIMDAKMAELKGYVRNVSSGQKKYQLNPETFITMFLNDAKLCDVITNFIDEALNISPESYSLEELLYAAFADILNSGDDSVSKMAQVLNLSEPIQYQKFTLKANKKRKRLKRNYEPKLNNNLADYSLEFKKIVLCFIKINCHAKRNNQAKVIYDEDLKANMPAGILALIEEISVLLVNNDVSVSLNENGEFYFEIKPVLSAEEEKECAEYDDKKNKVRKIHDKIFKLYKKNNFSYSSFMKENQVDSSLDENSNMIDITHWLSFDKIKILIDNINVKDLNSLSNEQFECLRNFMIEQGLLWAYVSGNVEASVIIKLINNFKALFYCIDKKDFNIQNLDVIIRYALIYDYADELVIGLVGFENIAKIISYNQFIDGNLTDEMIYSRLRKVVDLAVRSEQVTKSSLPYNCDINTNDYSLVRYKNNDPDIFSCGVDTKTCFFISVNENDFFFYSLLNKNGYVLKIVNKQNELIARASCLRKNNVLLINGIRYKNNKEIPGNAEELEVFKNIVHIITLFAKKMISLTSSDMCPIDYVVCNKAGILENGYFENKFERINDVLFKEPVNIYGDDWQEFVHMYDGQEQLLQEVPYDPDHSFTTDFGCNYPALLIASRDNKALVSPRDISLEDQPAIYERPRKNIVTYIGDEITDSVLEEINRIRALNCFVGTPEEQEKKKQEFHLLQNADGINNITIGEDWFILVDNNGIFRTVYASDKNVKSYKEAQDTLKSYIFTEEVDPDGVKIYKLIGALDPVVKKI